MQLGWARPWTGLWTVGTGLVPQSTMDQWRSHGGAPWEGAQAHRRAAETVLPASAYEREVTKVTRGNGKLDRGHDTGGGTHHDGDSDDDL